MSYMEKKTSKRQTTIISLSDQNQKEILDLKDAKKLMQEEYEEKKQGMIYDYIHVSYKLISNLSIVQRYKRYPVSFQLPDS